MQGGVAIGSVEADIGDDRVQGFELTIHGIFKRKIDIEAFLKHLHNHGENLAALFERDMEAFIGETNAAVDVGDIHDIEL